MKIMHVGMPKAGSTYLQSLVFPKILGVTANTFSCTSFVFNWLEMIRTGTNHEELPLIVSNENLFGFPGHLGSKVSSYPDFQGINSFLKVVEEFKPVSSQVVPFVVVRDPARAVKAMFIQNLKNRLGPPTLNEYLSLCDPSDFSVYERLCVLKDYNTIAIFQDDLRQYSQLVCDLLCNTMSIPKYDMPANTASNSVNLTPRTYLGLFLCRNAGSLSRRLLMAENIINKVNKSLFRHPLINYSNRDNVNSYWKDKAIRIGDNFNLLNKELIFDRINPLWEEFLEKDWKKTKAIMKELRPSCLPG